MNVIIPIGGVGKRFSDDGFSRPKPMIMARGEPIIYWAIKSLKLEQEDILWIGYRPELDIFRFQEALLFHFPDINFRFIKINTVTNGAAETVDIILDQLGSELSNLTLIIDSDNFYPEDDIVSTSKKENSNLVFYHFDNNPNPLFSYISEENGVLKEIREKQKISDLACVGAYCFHSGERLKLLISEARKKQQNGELYISALYQQLLLQNEVVKTMPISKFYCLGTPNQLKSFSSQANNVGPKLRFCFDLDNTLVSFPKIRGDYSTVEPIQKNIDFVNYLYSQGHTIIIYTARRMKTFGGDVQAVIQDIEGTTLSNLQTFDIHYHELHMGKPYAHFYIDDLGINAFEDIEKELGFFQLHPQPREHNMIEFTEESVIKTSNDISGEKYYYENIPQSCRDLFPRLLKSGDNFIEIEIINGIPLSFLNISGQLNDLMIKRVLDTVTRLHSTPITKERVNIYGNYKQKLLHRFSSYDYLRFKDFAQYRDNILDYLECYEDENRGIQSVIHGDPVLCNIILDAKNNLKLIDMRGRIGDQRTIEGDRFYDLAKIYQSIIGYDFVLAREPLNLSYIERNKASFWDWIKNVYPSSLEDIKMITKSLLISLIPLHNNEKCQGYFDLMSAV